MLKINQAIIVEGKYDKIKLSSIIDALIIDVGGFHIFKDKEMTQLISTLANTRGIVIMTDSDNAGKLIRNKINSIASSGKVYNAYIPQILGKEKRKTEPSKEGYLGVEGVCKEIIIQSLNRCGIDNREVDANAPKITNFDLYELGYTGKSYSKKLREKLLKRLNLPNNLSKNNLLNIISYELSVNDLKDITNSIMEELENGR